MSTPAASIPTAQQPSATTALQASGVPLNAAGVARLGSMLYGRYKQYEQDRRMAELQWEKNSRQYQGIYDPDIERAMDANRSRAYPKITRVKCVSMLSRLMNLLFPVDDKNWTVEPSAVPVLDNDDLQGILDMLMPPPAPDADMAPIAGAAAMPSGAPAAPPPTPPSDDVIEQAIRDFAKKRARRMELEIEDQLQELGGARAVSYVTLCRKVLASGIQYGAGILKGPFVVEQDTRTWQLNEQGRLMAQTKTSYRPRFEHTPLWNYYPDMTAKTLAQMDGQFERVVLTRHQLLDLKQRADFLPDQIDLALRSYPNGNYVRRAYETELLVNGPQLNAQHTSRNKFEAYVWEGFVTGTELAAAGATIAEKDMQSDLKATVWVINDVVIKAALNPWSQLDPTADMQMYHHFIFEESESFLLGNALPQIMRDSQMGVCAATRMSLDNASIQRNMEVNTRKLRLDQDISSVEPDKIWYRDDDGPESQYPAVRAIEIPMHLTELQSLVSMFQNFADQETFVNAATGGDMQKGPSEPFRTATGASMLRGDAALPFKDVVRNFDAFTESVIGAILIFNKHFNPSPNLNGDFQPVARGATSLIAKEVLGTQLDQLAQTLTDQEKPYLKARNLLRARVRVRDMDTEDIVMNDAECDAVDQQTQQAQQAQQAQAQQLATAQIRQILADALKNVSQAGKNTAAAEATTANVILDALQKGLNPDDLTPQGLNGQPNASQDAEPGAAGPGPGAGTGVASSALPAGPGNGGAAQAAGNPFAGSPAATAAMPA